MNRERVQMLRNMIAGIPQKQMNLNSFYRKNGEPCGTIACIAGWAAIYPPFIEEGLYVAVARLHYDQVPWFDGFSGTSAAANFFDVDRLSFDVRQPHERGTHKQIALRRLDALLRKAS